MFVLLIILFIIECIGFCYLFFNILEINKDIEILYDTYSKELEKLTKLNLKLRGYKLK